MKISKKKLLLQMARVCVNDKELCEKAKIGLSTLANVKRGSQTIMPATVGKIALALSIDPEDLIED